MAGSQKLKKTTLSDQVCKIIKDKIKDKEWPEGSKIPSENELAEAFGVNRLTVRNALQKLSGTGIVETRAGEGTFVKQFDIMEYISEMSDFVTSPEMLEGVKEFRKCIETECARFAIERASADDIRQLEEVCTHYESVATEQIMSFDDHMNAIINADLDFHYQICKMSKNSLFVLAYSTARESIFRYVKSVFLNRYVSYTFGARQNLASSTALDNHKKIIEAIKKRDFDLYRKVSDEMIDYEQLD